MSSTVYQAKQKLENISRANPVLSEELIKYSHKISASNAVCAPLNWQQGDPRRPYPTDIEMRGGFLARAELPMAQQLASVTLPPPPRQRTVLGRLSHPIPIAYCVFGRGFEHTNSDFQWSAARGAARS